MKVVFIVKGREAKSKAEECAKDFSDALKLKVDHFGEELYVIAATAAADGLEGAEILSGFLDSVVKKLGGVKKKIKPIRILCDDASAMFGRLLYPALCEFETRLRSAVIIAMCADEANFDNSLVTELESTDLGWLNCQLLEEHFATRAAAVFGDKTLGKRELIERIEAIDDGPLWDRLFCNGELVSVRGKFGLIRARRNDVMHFHTISYKAYSNAAEALMLVNEELEAYIGRALADEDYPASREAAARNASRQLAGNYAGMISAMSNAIAAINGLTADVNQLQGVSHALEQYAEIGKPARAAMDEALSACDFSGITAALSQFDPEKMGLTAPKIDLSQSPHYADMTRKLSEAIPPLTFDSTMFDVGQPGNAAEEGGGPTDENGFDGLRGDGLSGNEGDRDDNEGSAS